MVHNTHKMNNAYKNYDETSKVTLEAHRKMLAMSFDTKYPLLASSADVLLTPFPEYIFHGLDTAPAHTRRECPGAPLRKQEYLN
jgi:hypothetical protein